MDCVLAIASFLWVRETLPNAPIARLSVLMFLMFSLIAASLSILETMLLLPLPYPNGGHGLSQE